MIPDPLHPSIVHFPVVFMFLLPLAIAWALWATRRGSSARRTWTLPVATALLLAAGTWVAVQTGEAEEDRVEEVVDHDLIHEHEEAAEWFRNLATGLFAVTLAGFLTRAAGRAARLVTLLGALGLITIGFRTAQLGGELVYVHGAGAAYTEGASAPGSEP